MNHLQSPWITINQSITIKLSPYKNPKSHKSPHKHDIITIKSQIPTKSPFIIIKSHKFPINHHIITTKSPQNHTNSQEITIKSYKIAIFDGIPMVSILNSFPILQPPRPLHLSRNASLQPWRWRAPPAPAGPARRRAPRWRRRGEAGFAYRNHGDFTIKEGDVMGI
jgi:hypothetical protein